MEKIFTGLLTILLSIALVYLLVCVACWAWGYVCVSAFGFPMLTKMQMLMLIFLINLLSPFHYSRESK